MIVYNLTLNGGDLSLHFDRRRKWHRVIRWIGLAIVIVNYWVLLFGIHRTARIFLSNNLQLLKLALSLRFCQRIFSPLRVNFLSCNFSQSQLSRRRLLQATVGGVPDHMFRHSLQVFARLNRSVCIFRILQRDIGFDVLARLEPPTRLVESLGGIPILPINGHVLDISDLVRNCDGISFLWFWLINETWRMRRFILKNLLLFQRRLLWNCWSGWSQKGTAGLRNLAGLIENFQAARTIEITDVNLVGNLTLILIERSIA